MQILVATNNKGKCLEFMRLLNIADLELVLPADIGLAAFDVEETGTTYLENASLKATAFAQASQMYALADDSGLEVAALNNEPGVYSKRYAGEDKTDTERIAFLLNKLQNVPANRREAHFVAVLALADPTGKIIASETGLCLGEIVFQSRGSNGFGYDPIFLVDDTNGCTMAELDDAEKDRVSHRGNAVRAISSNLNKILNLKSV